MKAVQLLPGSTPAIKAEAAPPNTKVLGGALAGMLLVLGIAGYFAFARVESIKDEAAVLAQGAADAAATTQAKQSELAALGRPVGDADRELAAGAEQMLVSSYGERRDYVLLATELSNIMDNTGGWYSEVTAATFGPADTGKGTEKSVVLEGYMPNAEMAAGFNERVNGTRSLSNAQTITVRAERLVDPKTNKAGDYFYFKVHADLAGSEDPTGKADAAATGETPGATVSDSDAPETPELSLALEPEPAPAAPRASATASDNPFARAAAAAAGSGS